MRAAIYAGNNRMAVTDVEKPSPAAGEVVLKVHNCGICGSDLHAVQYGMGLKPGCVMGHEFCGEIHEVGTGVAGFKRGDRVTSLPYIACGTCEACKRDDAMQCPNIKGLGLGQLHGAYAEYVLCGERSLIKIPDKVSSREGALVEPLSVGLHGVNRSKLKPGMGVVVMGAGPIGLSTLLWCKAKGAEAVVVSELAPGRTELAMKLGATAVVNPNESDPAEKVRQLTGRPPEIVFECIGVKSTLTSAINLVARHGQIVVIGVCMEPDLIVPLTCVMKEVRVDFALAYTHAEFHETIEALESGKVKATAMITDVIDVAEIPDMFEALKRPGSRAKVMVEFAHYSERPERCATTPARLLLSRRTLSENP